MARTARGTLRSCGICNRCGRHIYGLWLASAKRPAGERRTRGRSRRVVLVAEFFLVGNGRYCGRVFGFSIGLYEYGKPTTSGTHSYSNSLDCSSIRLDHIISGGGWFVRGWRGELAGGGSIATTHGSDSGRRQTAERICRRDCCIYASARRDATFSALAMHGPDICWARFCLRRRGRLLLPLNSARPHLAPSVFRKWSGR